MAVWLTDPIKNSILRSPIVIVADTETTGLSPDKGASLLEIGAIRLDVKEKKICGSFSSMIRPRLTGYVPKKITELTGITNADIIGAPSEEYVMQQFYDFAGNVPFVFHNAVFDWRFLEKAFTRIGKHPVNDIIDTVRMSKHLHPDLKKHNLEALTTYYGKKIEGHHRAVVDAKYTASLYIKMRNELLQKESLLSHDFDLEQRLPISEIDVSTIKIFKINPWRKKDQERIYIYTNLGTFCYDHTHRSWFVTDLRAVKNLDISKCAKQIMNCLGCETEQALISKWPA